MLTYTKTVVIVIQYLLLTVPSRCQVQRWDGLLELVDPLLRVDICDDSLCYQIICGLWDRGDSVVQPVVVVFPLYIIIHLPDGSKGGGWR